MLTAGLSADCVGPEARTETSGGAIPGSQLHFSRHPPSSEFKPHPTDFSLQMGHGCPCISAPACPVLPPRRPLA